ncbi:unnamed protein product [Litomosoides sigmodontis]|uniref:Uncharacterized protein n=1 Tax=Litomosoides sigmodontis TaxID=42156 RepID=A0A3P6U7R3_LITSI|nr:unnamed protein product [Litomosoides sigmodontis]
MRSLSDRRNEILGYANFVHHFYEKNMQMTRTWQTLSNDQTVLLLQNVTGKYSIFDAKHGNLMPVLDNEDYSNLTPIASFFGMDNAEEFTELG